MEPGFFIDHDHSISREDVLRVFEFIYGGLSIRESKASRFDLVPDIVAMEKAVVLATELKPRKHWEKWTQAPRSAKRRPRSQRGKY